MGDEDFIDFNASSDEFTSAADYIDDSGNTGGTEWPLPSLGSLVGAGNALYRGNGSPYFQQTAGSFPGVAGAAMAGVVSLGAKLAAMVGRSGGRFVINGVKGSMASLWPYVRKYGPAAVAGALAISVEQLGQLLMSAPQQPRKRRRGISAADIRRTKRVIRFNRQLSRQLGMGRGGRGYYRPRRRYAYC